MVSPLRHRQGQAITDFLVVMAALTALGLTFLYFFNPSNGGTAAVAQINTTEKIAAD